MIVLLVVAIAASIIVIVMLRSKDNEAYRTIKVIETSGQVTVNKGTSEYAAYPGMILEEGYELETSKDSYVRLILDDDKYVKVEEESKIVFETLGLLGSNKTKIKIEQGAMTCEIVSPLQGDDDFIINTPNSVLGVRGTFFRVELEYNEDGLVKTNVTTYGGKVAVQGMLSTGELVGDEVEVNAGHKLIINQVNKADGDSNIEDITFESHTISIEDVSNEDLIDIYFAIENGHDMFVGKEDVKEALDIRGIDIKEHISVYEKAKDIKEEEVKDTTVKSEIESTEEPTTKDNKVYEVYVNGKGYDVGDTVKFSVSLKANDTEFTSCCPSFNIAYEGNTNPEEIAGFIEFDTIEDSPLLVCNTGFDEYDKEYYYYWAFFDLLARWNNPDAPPLDITEGVYVYTAVVTFNEPGNYNVSVTSGNGNEDMVEEFAKYDNCFTVEIVE